MTITSAEADQKVPSLISAMAVTVWVSARRMRVETLALPARGPRWTRDDIGLRIFFVEDMNRLDVIGRGHRAVDRRRRATPCCRFRRAAARRVGPGPCGSMLRRPRCGSPHACARASLAPARAAIVAARRRPIHRPARRSRLGFRLPMEVSDRVSRFSRARWRGKPPHPRSARRSISACRVGRRHPVEAVERVIGRHDCVGVELVAVDHAQPQLPGGPTRAGALRSGARLPWNRSSGNGPE